MIPYYEDSAVRNSRKEPFVRNLAQLIGLPNINYGKDELYIRIWLWDESGNYVVNIWDSSRIKDCSVIQFHGARRDSVQYIAIVKEWKHLTPKSGWNAFLDTLYKYEVPELPTGTIQNQKKGALTLMSYVQFEVSRLENYRYYEYLQPSYFRFMDTNSSKVFHFLKFLNKELGLVVYRPKEQFFLKP